MPELGLDGVVERSEPARLQVRNVLIQRIDEHRERQVVLELRRRAGQNEVPPRSGANGDLMQQPSLADPRFADHLDRAGTASIQLVEDPLQRTKLVCPPHEAPGKQKSHPLFRALEWRRSEFATEERHKVAGIVVDKAGHEVYVDGRAVQLTAKEFALLAYLCERRGKVLSREHLLARVWGNRYEGGPRTVDIHVRRLRAKLGPALPLETLRGSGYKLRSPDTEEPLPRGKEDEALESE